MVAGSTRFLLLRHGQSEWNAVRRWQGLADSPLTDLGRDQAIACGSVLRALTDEFTAVWSSPLSRAHETARIIADRLGLGSVATQPDLREADAGEWQGLMTHEIEAAYPGFLEARRRPPTFEPGDQVVGRALATLGAIARSSGDGTNVVIATHSGVIRSLVRHLGAHDERIPNLGGVWLEMFAGSTTDTTVSFDLGDRFDPGDGFDGVAVTGVDAHGEDPGDQSDHADAHRSADR